MMSRTQRSKSLASIYSEGGVVFGSQPLSDNEQRNDERQWFVKDPDGVEHECSSYAEARELCNNLNWSVSWTEELKLFKQTRRA